MNSQNASTSMSGMKVEMSKIEDGKVEKTLEDSSTIQMESLADKLPPEMVLKILKHLDTLTVVACRLVHSQWTGVASEICRLRSDLEIQFTCVNSKGKLFITDLLHGGLARFQKCLDGSKIFPFTRFHFESVDVSTFNNKDWTKFISDYGENITCLKLKMSPHGKAPGKLAVKLRALLLTSLPNLREFGIELNASASQVELFPESPMNQADPDPDPGPVQLSNIKILYLSGNYFKWTCDVISNLLQATVNLEKIEPFSKECEPFQEIFFIHSQGKIHCLDSVAIELSQEFLSKIEENPAALQELKLKELNLAVKYNRDNVPNPPQLFYIFLDSQKDTLEKLTIKALGHLTELQLPKFSKVTSLCILYDSFASTLPDGMKLGVIFPALRSLELDCNSQLYQIYDSYKSEEFDFDYRLQKVETLQVPENFTSGGCIWRASCLFPNLKHLKFKICKGESRSSICSYRESDNDIWTHLRKLQSLELVLDMKDKLNAFPAIDSCITGFSEEDCLRLYELIKIKEEKLSQGKVVESNLDLDFEPERKNPSILDLKDLKLLKILVKGQSCSPDMMEVGILSISEEFAFKRMDNLKYEIETIE